MKRLLLFLSIFMAGFIPVDSVYASYVDVKTSISNSFSATTLDFSLRDTADTVLNSPLFKISGILPGGTETKTIRVKKEGFADLKYQASVVKTSGDDALCNVLQVEAKLEGIVRYSGSLLGLGFTPITISGDQDDWDFTVSLGSSSGAASNKSCSFDLRVKGFQTDSDGTWGFSDEEILGNSVTSGNWAAFGDVVINEVMWTGSKEKSQDEWLELRNTTGVGINLSGWVIENAGAGSRSTIALEGTIPANGFFLISNYLANDPHSALKDTIVVDQRLDLSLKNEGEQLTLKNNSGVVIDQTPDSGWPAGAKGPSDWQSMERNDTPGNGILAGSWHTCVDSGCRSATFWDSEGNNYGTPKAANLSSNDPPTSQKDPETAPIIPNPPSVATSSAVIQTPSPLPEINSGTNPNSASDSAGLIN